MNDTTSTKKAVEPIDFEKPIYMTIRQTPSRNVINFFPTQEEAETHAADAAMKSRGPVAILGPQVAVAAPPPPVAVEVVRMDFGSKDT